MNFRSSIAAAVLLAMVLAAGCGKKTALVPPQKLVPERIDDLRFALDDKGATLIWSYPTKLVSGDNLPAVESFTIYRAAVPVGEYCPDCPVRFVDLVELDGGRLGETDETRVAVYTDSYLQPGYRYFYKVRSTAGFRYPSNDSNTVTFVWQETPEAPANLELEAGDRRIILQWDPVKQSTAGTSLNKEPIYQVYRKSGNAEFTAVGEPVSQPEFIDNSVRNEQQYTYEVRALLPGVVEAQQPGKASRAVSGIPRDLEPPEPPQHLLAVNTEAGIKLIWQSVSASDLAGYRIYRRQGTTSQAEFLAEVGADQNQFIDRLDGAGSLWYYSVTSFDNAVPFNESVPAAEAVIDLR